MTGKECLSYYRGFKERVEDKYVKQLIDRFELDLSKRVSDYSKGNKQKLAIILALMHKPKLLILDEPTSGLDPLNQQTFYDCILETKSWGATTFFSTHILDEAQRICDRVGIIKAGHLIRIEDIEEFRQKNIRDIHITTKADIPAAALQAAGVNKVEKTKAGYHLTTFGKNGAVIKQLASYDIDDMAINQPSLEEVFIRFYKED
ncbi:MAG: Fluoroquinolones export ATP-binding protein [bacterium ADurb.Bin400]|nr:MAG: Fluoroquinolones export ATP-binding protein [bacterium ADurb.Bin400]